MGKVYVHDLIIDVSAYYSEEDINKIKNIITNSANSIFNGSFISCKVEDVIEKRIYTTVKIEREDFNLKFENLIENIFRYVLGSKGYYPSVVLLANRIEND
jgi:hypothetical protein